MYVFGEPELSARINISSCRLAGNAASAAGGAVSAWGAVTLTAVDSSLTGNSGGSGGAVAAGMGAHLDVQGSTLAGNVAGSAAPGALSASACSAGTSTGAGGAVWLGPGGSASLSLSTVANNTAQGSGGAAALSEGSIMALTDSAVVGNYADEAGGAWAVAGTASLTVANSSVVANDAHFGGVLGLSGQQPGESVWNISLGALFISANTADAGAFAAVLDSTEPFDAPSCLNCSVGVAGAARSYGNHTATHPAKLLSSAPPTVRPGGLLVTELSVYDGFDQLVLALPTGIASAECTSQQANSTETNSCALAGDSRGVYKDGKAQLSPIVFGVPQARISLQLVLEALGTPAFAGMATINVSVEECRSLEGFAEESHTCQCVDFASMGATGACACTSGAAQLVDGAMACVQPEHVLPIPLVVGVVVGGTVFLLLVGVTSSILVTRRSEARKWRMRGATEAAIRRELASRLQQAEMEHEILSAGEDIIKMLYPTAAATAIATFGRHGLKKVGQVKVSSNTLHGQHALAAAITPDVGDVKEDSSNNSSGCTSVWWVCDFSGGMVAADSREHPAGVSAFLDWASARDGGLKSVRAITAPLMARSPPLSMLPQRHTRSASALLHHQRGFHRLLCLHAKSPFSAIALLVSLLAQASLSAAHARALRR